MEKGLKMITIATEGQEVRINKIDNHLLIRERTCKLVPIISWNLHPLNAITQITCRHRRSSIRIPTQKKTVLTYLESIKISSLHLIARVQGSSSHSAT
jgi:hypothetical protein